MGALPADRAATPYKEFEESAAYARLLSLVCTIVRNCTNGSCDL
jgi:hypothetical protein